MHSGRQEIDPWEIFTRSSFCTKMAIGELFFFNNFFTSSHAELLGSSRLPNKTQQTKLDENLKFIFEKLTLTLSFFDYKLKVKLLQIIPENLANSKNERTNC